MPINSPVIYHVFGIWTNSAQFHNSALYFWRFYIYPIDERDFKITARSPIILRLGQVGCYGLMVHALATIDWGSMLKIGINKNQLQVVLLVHLVIGRNVRACLGNAPGIGFE